jgi:molybdenum cofactor cytidylyltransferase
MPDIVSGVSAVLLAAGESRRMGEFKQLLKMGGKSFVQCCADALLQSRADEVIVVTGHRAGEVERELSGMPVRFVHNADYRLGMSSSIKCGLAALSPNSRACLIALADQPLIDHKTVDKLIGAYEAGHPAVVLPTHQGKRGHPILLDTSLRDEVLGIDSSVGLRAVIARHLKQAVCVEVGTDSVLIDFDLPEEYQAALDG